MTGGGTSYQLNTQFKNPEREEQAEIEVIDPRHPLFGCHFPLISVYERTQTRGIPRPGAALLQGMVYCGECRHKLAVQYKGGTHLDSTCPLSGGRASSPNRRKGAPALSHRQGGGSSTNA